MVGVPVDAGVVVLPGPGRTMRHAKRGEKVGQVRPRIKTQVKFIAHRNITMAAAVAACRRKAAVQIVDGRQVVYNLC